MNVLHRTKRRVHVVAACSAALTLTTPLAGHEAPVDSLRPGVTAAAPASYDEGLIFSNDGATLLLRNYSPGADHAERLRLETDACGLVVSMENGHAMLTQGALADDADDADAFDEDDPSVAGQTLVSRWLSMHPEVAVITDGIAKWCDEPLPSDEELAPESDADWRVQSLHSGLGRGSWPEGSSYIA